MSGIFLKNWNSVNACRVGVGPTGQKGVGLVMLPILGSDGAGLFKMIPLGAMLI
ncbi:MAG TPA: hypothetical protein VGN20_16605 [Mucilaginibacter sp.]|jgi:hypothetical protein